MSQKYAVKKTYMGDDNDTKIKNQIEVKMSGNGQNRNFQPNQFTVETHRTEKTNELDLDSPFKNSPTKVFKNQSDIEELEYPAEQNSSDLKDKENSRNKWNRLFKINSNDVPKVLFESKVIRAKSPDFIKKTNGNLIGKDSKQIASRNFRSIDKFESSKCFYPSENSETNFKKGNIENWLKKRARPVCNKPKAVSVLSPSFTESIKNFASSPVFSHSHFQTYSCNRSTNPKLAKDNLFQDIMRKTTQSFVSPFLKNRFCGDFKGKEKAVGGKQNKEKTKCSIGKFSE